MVPDALEVNNISKKYNGKCVINSLSFKLHKGHIGCLLGESGCGKTTILRCIAGFETIQSGSIFIDGSPVTNSKNCVPPENRRLGMVFQDYALFPHLTVRKNIIFGLKDLNKSKLKRRVLEMLDLVGLMTQRNIRMNYPVDSNSASPWQEHWHQIPIFCLWMSLFQISMYPCVNGLVLMLEKFSRILESVHFSLLIINMRPLRWLTQSV